MQKKVLSEQIIYFGDVKMPKGFDIDPFEMSKAIFESSYTGQDMPFFKTWDKLNRYIIEHVRIKFNLNLVNKKTWGKMYFPNVKTDPTIEVNAVDCNVRIYYDDNRKKGRSWDIPLTHNKFIMFPATNLYYIENNQKDLANFVQVITYELI